MRRGSAAFLVREGRVLLAKRSSHRALYPDVWDAVGGHLQHGETPGDALMRELEEELGVRPSAFQEIAVVDEPQPDLYGPAKYHIFVVTAWQGGEPRMLGAEHSAIEWCTLDQALTMRLADSGYAALLHQVLESDTGSDG